MGTVQTAATQVVPPAPAVKVAAVVLLPVLLVAVGAGLVSGSVGLLAFLLGVLAGLPVAILAGQVPLRATVAALCAAGLVGGLYVAPLPWVEALAVFAAGLVQAPLNRRSAGIATMLPVLVAVTATRDLPDRPVTVAVCGLLGIAVVTLTARLLRASVPVPGVPARTAWRHALAVAFGAALAVGIMEWQDLPGDIVVVLTLAVVLRPIPGETVQRARDRLAGTALGVVVAVVLVAITPTPLVLVITGLCLLLTFAWAIAGQPRRQVVFATPIPLLVGASGLAGEAAGLGVQRLILVLVAVLIAVGLSVLLLRADQEDQEPAPLHNPPGE